MPALPILPRYVLDTNLVGALNCLEFARKRCGGFVFLSSSRVYSIEPLAQLPVVKCSSRFELRDGDCNIPGVSPDGVTESFPCNTHRSYYGASKLAAELVMPGIRVARRIARCDQPLRRHRGTWPVWED